jgi:hypothetical protein
MSGSSTLPLPLKFRICDIRGLEVDHLMNKENMRYILEGNIADRYPVSTVNSICNDTAYNDIPLITIYRL